jgi:hypothetical protein
LLFPIDSMLPGWPSRQKNVLFWIEGNDLLPDRVGMRRIPSLRMRIFYVQPCLCGSLQRVSRQGFLLPGKDGLANGGDQARARISVPFRSSDYMLYGIVVHLWYWETKVFFCLRSACFAAVEDDEDIAARRADGIADTVPMDGRGFGRVDMTIYPC